MANPRFTKEGKPIGYVLGVTPGFAKASPTELQLRRMGLPRKLAEAARLGFEFAMIDFEELGEAYEPELAKQIRIIKEANHIELGIHLPYWMDLTIAYSYEWRVVQDQLRIGTRAAKECGAKFVLFHSSSHARPNIAGVFGKPEPRAKLVGPDGTNFGDWIIKVDPSGKLKEWFMAKFIRVLYAATGAAADPAVVEYFAGEDSFKEGSRKVINLVERTMKRREEKRKALELELRKREKRIRELEKLNGKRGLSPEELEEYKKILEEMATISSKIKEMDSYEYFISELRKEVGKDAEKIYEVYLALRRFDWELIFDYWRREGSEAEEYVAYLTVAEHMFRTKDKIWKAIVKTDEDPWKLARKGIEEMGKSAKIPNYIKQIVAAVAAKYIEGHLRASGEQYGIEWPEGSGKYVSIYDFCRQNGMMIYMETAMPEKGAEGELRIMSALDHINICKAIDGGRILNYCMDFEHLLVNLINPIKEAELILKHQPGDAKYVSCIHMNAPRPLVGAHAPIEVTSPDMAVLYEWLYILKKAGMENAYLIWEMGSYGVEQSAIAFRNMVRELTKSPPTPPKELPPEFFGIDRDFEARTRVAIMQHAFEPLRNLTVMPEKEWGVLSSRARERGRLREWEMEKYK